MYDIRQFRPALYAVLLVGLSGYAMAAETPGMWVFAVALVLTNAWLIKQKQFRPMPRVLANMVTISAAVYTYAQLQHRSGSPILAVGQFLVLLQVVKVWEQRANRDYAQLLVLSLLLMVAAAISTASLVFGIIFVIYLIGSLYCCLLFHLKVETDQARRAAVRDATGLMNAPVVEPSQANLSSSMRRLTALVGTYAMVGAVLVFLFFPRAIGAGMFGQFQWRSRDTLTGFSEQVSFQTVARIQQNDEAVGTVKIWKGDQSIQLRGPLMLRGATHDYYNGNDNSKNAPFQWSAALPLPGGGRRWRGNINNEMIKQRETWVPQPDRLPTTARFNDDDLLRQEFDLSPTGTPVIFALAGPMSVRPVDSANLSRLNLRYDPYDECIRANFPMREPIKYEVFSRGELGNEELPHRQKSKIDPQITAFARQPAVVGDLANQRDAEVALNPDRALGYVSPLDGQIAAKVEDYLRKNYKYTLDLTATASVTDRDPIVGFLTDFKKGHCEYFAGAMTLMCQSLGLDARLVVGFKCDDYNKFGQFYQIRQSDAHAWVEVKTVDGWKTYDPTSGSKDDAGQASVWSQTKYFFNYLEYTWQNAVISYNADQRDNLIATVNNKMTLPGRETGTVAKIKALLDDLGDWLASRIVGPMVALLSLAILASVGWYLFERWKLRRRASRIGIAALPLAEQAKLVRQLGFYDDLLLLLEKQQITRPPHLTPLEFSKSLSYLPATVYDTIHRLTGLFYKIRYGHAEIDEGQQRRLTNVIARLATQLPTG